MAKKSTNKTNEEEIKTKQAVSITKLMQEHYKWIIAAVPLLSVIILNILKFIEYLTATIYFKYYGLDIELYKYHDQNFLYGLCFSLISFFAYGSLLYCFKQIRVRIKNKEYFNKSNIYNIFVILIFNFVLIVMVSTEANIWIYLISFVAFLFMEYITSKFAFPNDVEKNDEKDFEFKEEFVNLIKNLPFLIILLIFCHWLRIYSSLTLNKEYRIINDSKVIVYSNSEYYLTLDCEIDNNDLIIYKGTQDKIETMNVYNKLKKFNEIKLK